jgi:hypothetical protein
MNITYDTVCLIEAGIFVLHVLPVGPHVVVLTIDDVGGRTRIR